MKNSALVVIDLQNDITKHYREIIDPVNAAIDWAVQKELWVIYIQHNNLSAGTRTFKPGTRGAELVSELNVVSGHIFTKSKSNALTSEAFAAFIQEHGISEFYIVGADAAACIKSTCFNMRKGGYAVHVLSDCITAMIKRSCRRCLRIMRVKAALSQSFLTPCRHMQRMEILNMKKLYEKSELTFALVWIAVYCVLQSLANPLNEIIGTAYAASAAFCVLQTIVLFVFIRRNGLQKRYGLCRSSVPARRFLYYVPLVILASGNLWNGAALTCSPAETVCRVVCMLCVGFLEEVIFRGLLFTAIARNNIKSAVIISSVTFGIGHIINLFNGSGMELVSNLCQIVFAIAVGFLLVTIFSRGGSLLPCILVHSAINTLGTFANDAELTMQTQLLHLAALILLTVGYTLILTRTLPRNTEQV